jgi:hypothetical protein
MSLAHRVVVDFAAMNVMLPQFRPSALAPPPMSDYDLSDKIVMSSGVAKDAWESVRLHAIPFDPHDAADFCSEPSRRFSAFGLIAIVHALIHEFGFADTEGAFKKARVTISQKLPAWLVSDG